MVGLYQKNRIANLPVKCANCEWTGPLHKRDSHINIECQNKLITCPLSLSGCCYAKDCTVLIPRKLLMKHVFDAVLKPQPQSDTVEKIKHCYARGGLPKDWVFTTDATTKVRVIERQQMKNVGLLIDFQAPSTVYFGEMLNCVENGVGTMIYSNGTAFHGLWKDGKRGTHGSFLQSDGN